MPYRLLAIDLDGTLFAKEDRVDARVVELLRKIAGGGHLRLYRHWQDVSQRGPLCPKNRG